MVGALEGHFDRQITCVGTRSGTVRACEGKQNDGNEGDSRQGPENIAAGGERRARRWRSSVGDGDGLIALGGLHGGKLWCNVRRGCAMMRREMLHE